MIIYITSLSHHFLHHSLIIFPLLPPFRHHHTIFYTILSSPSCPFLPHPITFIPFSAPFYHHLPAPSLSRHLPTPYFANLSFSFHILPSSLPFMHLPAPSFTTLPASSTNLFYPFCRHTPVVFKPFLLYPTLFLHHSSIFIPLSAPSRYLSAPSFISMLLPLQICHLPQKTFPFMHHQVNSFLHHSAIFIPVPESFFYLHTPFIPS